MTSTVPIVAAIEALRNKSGDLSQNLKAFINYTQEDEGASISAFNNGAFELLWGMRSSPHVLMICDVCEIMFDFVNIFLSIFFISSE